MYYKFKGYADYILFYTVCSESRVSDYGAGLPNSTLLIFYENGAKPVTQTYSFQQQRSIYEFTRGLSWGGVNRNNMPVLISRLRLLIFFGIFTFIRFIFFDFTQGVIKLKRLLK